ncbi:MAG: bifunctional phosphopantothenoylcysteine decarboxylase/phosphopantothenate--cysteine ligase CoaBC [Actinomycetota bacterium]
MRAASSGRDQGQVTSPPRRARQAGAPPFDLAGARVVLGVCGGIAAYKVVELARELTQAGAEVRVVMTAAATRFVGAVTFSTLTGHPVASELFPEPPPPEIVHTAIARSADLLVVAPATAAVIAKYARGLPDELLPAILLATRAPVIMAPAMHTEMWENEATRENVSTLAGRGIRFVGPEAGPLAGPDEGIGRLAEISSILEAILEELARSRELEGRRVLVTAGGTCEPIDPVRFMGNRSSGKMGYEIAAEALHRGAKVTLVSGPTHLAAPAGAETVGIETAAQMRQAVLEQAPAADVVIMAAAVADWRPATVHRHKLKRSSGPPEVELEATEDILAELARARRPDQVLVGFCAETEDLEARANEKMVSKSVDIMVGNLVGAEDSGFGLDTTRAILLDREGRIDRLGLLTKRQTARTLLDAVCDRFL